MAAAENGQRRKIRIITYGGILGSLILLALTGAAWSPTANLALFSLASLAVAISVIETGFTSGCVLYGATALISLAWPGLAFSWPYLVFFGPFPLLRAQVDRHFPPGPARLTRVLLGLLLATLSAAIMGRIVIQEQQALPGFLERLGLGVYVWPLLLLTAAIVILFYDWALSLMIAFYARRLRKSR